MAAIHSSSFAQVFKSLETLNNVMEGVFQKLTDRVCEVNDISNFSNTARKKAKSHPFLREFLLQNKE